MKIEEEKEQEKEQKEKPEIKQESHIEQEPWPTVQEYKPIGMAEKVEEYLGKMEKSGAVDELPVENDL